MRMHIFISGGTRGIGKAIALSQAKKGVSLYLNYLRDDESARAVKLEAEKKGASVTLLAGNIGDPEAVKEIFKKISAVTDRLDACVHSAALGVFKPVTQLRVKDWDISLDVNAKAFLVIAQEALPLMKKSGGSLVTISSLGARHFTPNYGAIGISKAALENLVRYLGVELAPHKVRVNAVSGGLVDTDSLQFFPDSQRVKDEYLKRTPLGRIGRPEDIARVVDFLLSDASLWICGQTLVADGGYSLF